LDIAATDLVTIGLLVVLEGLLSADNALVMAIMVLGLPRSDHHKALRYGLLGGFAFRAAATLLAVYLIQVGWVKVLGGLYLLYLTYSHFWGREEGEDRRQAPKAKTPNGCLSRKYCRCSRTNAILMANGWELPNRLMSQTR